jgi:hypothetical protein
MQIFIVVKTPTMREENYPQDLLVSSFLGRIIKRCTIKVAKTGLPLVIITESAILSKSRE